MRPYSHIQIRPWRTDGDREKHRAKLFFHHDIVWLMHLCGLPWFQMEIRFLCLTHTCTMDSFFRYESSGKDGSLEGNWKVGKFIYNSFKRSSEILMRSIFSFFKVFILKVFRSSCLQMFGKIGVLKNFAIFLGKHLYWSLFFIKM